MGTPYSGSIELKVKRLRYFSEGDETAFFNWIQRLSLVKIIRICYQRKTKAGSQLLAGSCIFYRRNFRNIDLQNNDR